MKKITVVFLMTLFFVLSYNFVFAQSTSQNNVGGTQTKQNNSSNVCAGSACTLTNPIGATTVQTLVGRLINTAMGVVGSIALLMFVYGGFTWMLSAGNSEKVKKGTDIVVWSALGMALVFMSYALVRFVLGIIQ